MEKFKYIYVVGKLIEDDFGRKRYALNRLPKYSKTILSSSYICDKKKFNRNDFELEYDILMSKEELKDFMKSQEHCLFLGATLTSDDRLILTRPENEEYVKEKIKDMKIILSDFLDILGKKKIVHSHHFEEYCEIRDGEQKYNYDLCIKVWQDFTISRNDLAYDCNIMLMKTSTVGYTMYLTARSQYNKKKIEYSGYVLNYEHLHILADGFMVNLLFDSFLSDVADYENYDENVRNLFKKYLKSS